MAGDTPPRPPPPLRPWTGGLYSTAAVVGVVSGQGRVPRNKRILVPRARAAADAVLRAAHQAASSQSRHRQRKEAGGASVTANGPWSRAQSSSVQRPHHVQVHGLLTGPSEQRNPHLKAQYYFHLIVIHEILQAYLQVLRRLLLNRLRRR